RRPGGGHDQRRAAAYPGRDEADLLAQPGAGHCGRGDRGAGHRHQPALGRLCRARRGSDRRVDGGAGAGGRGSGEVRRRPGPGDPPQPGRLPRRAGDPVTPVAVLVGPPGAGKTTVGELVAAALGVPFRDTDADIVETAGKPIPEIFFDDGEPHFRKLEAEAVATALETFDGVRALGAGAILAAPTRARLASHPVVYLEVSFADAIGRVGLGPGRPLLAMNPRATLRRLLDERRPLYEEVARLTVATDGRTAEEVAAEVVTRLRG